MSDGKSNSVHANFSKNNERVEKVEFKDSIEVIDNNFLVEENDFTNWHDLEEQQHFFDIFNTFNFYKSSFLRRIDKSCNFIIQMPEHHQKKLDPYRNHLNRLKLCVEHNYNLIELIISDVATMFNNATYMQNNTLVVKSEKELDTDRINSVLNQIVREWSNEGRLEREICFNPILSALERYYPELERRSDTNILVPGAALGRLIFEIANRGFSCQGNEYSLMMLFVANFILNKCNQTNCYTLYPWISQFSNNLVSNQQLASVKFPDVNPNDIPKTVKFSMAAGSFPEIYKGEHCKWDCIVTCFFLDTAANVISYIETIERILKSDGLWINFGPLLYHYADLPDPSIEPSYEIIKDIIISFGFQMIEEKTNVPSYYTRNPNSMLSYEYKSIYFVCRKIRKEI
ncbi:hypothetical protein BLOT_007492 [Blomia tropicalis]|nr:hypothetical protein BLOT_007492 [Blomia tropicalis]